MVEGETRIVNPLGLHARAAAQLVRVANGFQSKIMIARKDIPAAANAKSMLSILALAATFGTVIRIQVNGKDEREAFDAVLELVESGFGEILV